MFICEGGTLRMGLLYDSAAVVFESVSSDGLSLDAVAMVVERSV